MHTLRVLPLVPCQAQFTVFCMFLRVAFSVDHFVRRKRQEVEATADFWIPQTTPKRQDRGLKEMLFSMTLKRTGERR